MPKYYCDYCDTYLTHDSPSVRKTHCSGRKHKENVKFYYQKWMADEAQSFIDATTAAFKAGKIQSMNPQVPPVGVMIPPPPTYSYGGVGPVGHGVPGQQMPMMVPPPMGSMPGHMPGPMPVMPPHSPLPHMMVPGMRPPIGLSPMRQVGPVPAPHTPKL